MARCQHRDSAERRIGPPVPVLHDRRVPVAEVFKDRVAFLGIAHLKVMYHGNAPLLLPLFRATASASWTLEPVYPRQRRAGRIIGKFFSVFGIAKKGISSTNRPL